MILSLLLPGCSPPLRPPPETPVPKPAQPAPTPAAPETFESDYLSFQALAKQRVDAEQRKLNSPVPEQPVQDSKQAYRDFQNLGVEQGKEISEEFFKGRYDRSRARLPQNIEKWRSQPDIANPGPDQANFTNSAFTLPEGRAYIEFAPYTYNGPAPSAYTGTGGSAPSLYYTQYLLRYGLTDDIELRLFGNGASWSGGSNNYWGFSPVAFDTKINLWLEKQEYFLPAAAIEAYLQTDWLGATPFNVGTQPAVNFNFDQSLPLDILFEYNIGTARVPDRNGQNVWQFVFEWAVQRDFFDKDLALFAHGYYYNYEYTPRSATSPSGLPVIPAPRTHSPYQNVAGAGFIWTLNNRFAVYGQASGGTTQFSPSMVTMAGFAAAF
ncbi:MAG: transporter [Methylococcus sp.]|nr:transporter [Methylococcus sp.]